MPHFTFSLFTKVKEFIYCWLNCFDFVFLAGTTLIMVRIIPTHILLHLCEDTPRGKEEIKAIYKFVWFHFSPDYCLPMELGQ